jgi:N-acyl amino acid synthase of PEP-CTERM/exosortase system
MFDENYRVCFADTPYGVALHQRIRYQVFCLDRGFEDPDAFSAAREADDWDDQSAHFIVQSRSSGLWVAATRVVFQESGKALPVETIDALQRDRLTKPESRLAEISRFCIIRNRGASALEAHSDNVIVPAWGVGPIGKAQQFEVTVGMIRTFIVFLLKRKYEYAIMLVTDAFARLLRKLGFVTRQVGPVTEHRGLRTAYEIDLRATAISMANRSSQVRQMFRRSKHAYVRISSLADDPSVDLVSEFTPDHSLFNETVFHESVLMPSEQDSGLSIDPHSIDQPEDHLRYRKSS